jgi:pimeloyl-ACP methyl ester carboxylesterase
MMDVPMRATLRQFPGLALCLFMVCAVVWVPSARAAHLTFGWQAVDGVNLFFREGGPTTAPTVVFLHGNPSSSIMYQEVMERLVESRSVHVLAVDYPSFGYSDAPDHRSYRYTFDNVATTVAKFIALRGLERYGLYMQDYGVPIGFRLLTDHPTQVTALMVQNGVIHLDGFPSARDPRGELRQHWMKRNAAVDKRRIDYVNGLTFPSASNWMESRRLSPDAILLMTESERRPGVIEARNDLWFDYGSNVARYSTWQATLRQATTPLLVLWGSRDDFFTTPGALAYLRDVPGAEVHILDSVHFATLENPDEIATLISSFLERHGLAN